MKTCKDCIYCEKSIDSIGFPPDDSRIEVFHCRLLPKPEKVSFYHWCGQWVSEQGDIWVKEKVHVISDYAGVPEAERD